MRKYKVFCDGVDFYETHLETLRSYLSPFENPQQIGYETYGQINSIESSITQDMEPIKDGLYLYLEVFSRRCWNES